MLHYKTMNHQANAYFITLLCCIKPLIFSFLREEYSLPKFHVGRELPNLFCPSIIVNVHNVFFEKIMLSSSIITHVFPWTISHCQNSDKFTHSKQTSSAVIITLKWTVTLIEDLLQEGYSFILTARFLTDALELRLSWGRFLTIKSLLKEFLFVCEEDIRHFN